MTRAAENLTGRTFGRLTVIRSADGGGWMCRCRCGVRLPAPVPAWKLARGVKRSCGCLRRDVTAARSRTHGATRNRSATPEYRAWRAMMSRCYNPRNRKYPDYGGRGIRVYDLWQHSFTLFLGDVGPRPGPGYSLGRIDNDGDYRPGNVEWQTAHEQQRNTRRSRLVTFAGRTQPVVAWADELGINYFTLRDRLNRGRSPEEAFAVSGGNRGECTC